MIFNRLSATLRLVLAFVLVVAVASPAAAQVTIFSPFNIKEAMDPDIRKHANIAYADVEVDGVAGEQTKAAIRRFEKHYRLPETGEPNAMVLKKLKSIGAL